MTFQFDTSLAATCLWCLDHVLDDLFLNSHPLKKIWIDLYGNSWISVLRYFYFSCSRLSWKCTVFGNVTWHFIDVPSLFFLIAGAAQPEYTITADDCDNMVAIECVPMDERGRRVRGRYHSASSNCVELLLIKFLIFYKQISIWLLASSDIWVCLYLGSWLYFRSTENFAA
jgi:hypothetical protein